MANAIVEMGVNFVLGDGIQIDARHKKVQSLIDTFWWRAKMLAVAGGVLMPLGVLLVIAGWYGAAHTTRLFEEIPYLLFGARGAAEGELTLGGQVLDLASLTPSRAISAGMGLIPADRQRDGSVGSLPITDNLTLPVLHRYFTHLALSWKRMTREAGRLMEVFPRALLPPEGPAEVEVPAGAGAVGY